MPGGKRYSKKTKKWESVEEFRPVDFSEYNMGAWALLIGFFRMFPDIFLDILDEGTQGQKQFELELIQRVMLRGEVRNETCFITGPRGLTKTFSTVLGSMLTGTLWPGTKRSYFAPTMEQAAELAADAFNAIKERYPLLAQMWHVGSEAKGSFRIYTDYGSEFSVTVRRGSNKHSVIAEECAQSESGEAFDHEKFAQAVSATVRLKRKVGTTLDKTFPLYQKIYITSAGTQQNQAFEYRKEAFNRMVDGKNSFAIDVPWEVAVLSGIRDAKYYEDLRVQNTAEAFLRECCGVWTGTSENPVIRDSLLTESKNLTCMENRHCGNPDVIYVIGYDVSYVDGSANAKCATSVLKLEKKSDAYQANKYMKSFVYMIDEPPPKDALTQAKRLKDRWRRFCLADSEHVTYLAIDANQYGTAVVEELHKDLGDGMPPLCCINHDKAEIELRGAIPCIYPIRATGGLGGTHDSDTQMIQYAQREWEQGNVSLLINNIFDGVKAYKALHRIKDDSIDGQIAVPYLHTRDFCGQVSNLKTKAAGYGIKEVRISNRIQRDKWSATKYALRVADYLEHEELINSQRSDSEWKKVFDGEGIEEDTAAAYHPAPRTMVGRRGGNRR